jgi:hypothetical protein
VLCRLKTIFGGHSILYGFEFGGKELYDLAATDTDHVVVVLMLVIMLVVSAPVSEAHFSRQSGFGEELERAVNGGLADGLVFLLDQPVEVFARDVLFRAKKDIQDEVALRRAFQPRTLQVFQEYSLFFGHREIFCDGKGYLQLSRELILASAEGCVKKLESFARACYLLRRAGVAEWQTLRT